MPRRGSLFWAVVAVLVAGTLIYGPAELARRSTGPGEPVDFLTHPQEGWHFVADALREIGPAGLPGRGRGARGSGILGLDRAARAGGSPLRARSAGANRRRERRGDGE